MHVHTTFKAKYLGPTDRTGARYAVTDLWHGTRTLVPLDYSARDAASEAVNAAYWKHNDRTLHSIERSGDEGSNVHYYTVTVDI